MRYREHSQVLLKALQIFQVPWAEGNTPPYSLSPGVGRLAGQSTRAISEPMSLCNPLLMV